MGDAPAQRELADSAAAQERAGFRLHRLELFNWGTFDGRVWPLHAGGDTSLLTGDIGSGKSTVVDAITTLLVAPQRVAYNRAAGAEARERTVRSYVFGHYKAERSETGAGAKPVALRGATSYSVLLAHFFNEGYRQHVTLAQVFWMREQEGQPARLCVVADQELSIAGHFSSFEDIGALKRRLKAVTREVHDSFPPYQAAFRKRFGIHNDQALELFHQTVSLKSVGNLTDFVRQHMLQPFPVEERIQSLIAHVDDLTRAHEAVLRAKEQLARLTPLVDDCDQHRILSEKVAGDWACRDALRSWFASQRLELLAAAIEAFGREFEGLEQEIGQRQDEKRGLHEQRDAVKQDILRNGGERIERVRAELKASARERDERTRRAEAYDRSAAGAGLPAALDGPSFLANARQVAERKPGVEGEIGALRQQAIDAGVAFRQLTDQQRLLAAEVASLRQRRSNIPADFLHLRARLCEALELDPEALPFAGELMQVHPDDRLWEGAIERVLRAFGTSMLVSDEHYGPVSRWVDQNHLGMRLVYHRVKEGKQPRAPASGPGSLVRKMEFKHGSPFADWVEAEVCRHFNPVCCDTLDEFRREKDALTRSGQLKGGFKHTKDDRHRVDDRTRYVLGWSNLEKLEAMERELQGVEAQAQRAASAIGAATQAERGLEGKLDCLKLLAAYSRFEDLDWRSSEAEHRRLAAELEALEKSSDMLWTLEKRLEALETGLLQCEEAISGVRDWRTRADERRQEMQRQHAAAAAVVEAASAGERERFARLELLQAESGATAALTVDNGVALERELREWLQARLDADESRRQRLGERIVSAMQAYRSAYPLETREADASLEASGEYRRMLTTLRSDDLPRFELRFKELLNENTIREVANFQSQLRRERQEITERIETINRSLRQIDFNPGRFIRLEAANATDAEVRDFQQDLKACTEGTLTGAGDEAYSENKFLQVKKIIERLQGREGSTDIDLKWTRKVTDVRNWFTFSASERWAEDDREYEHYTDSGGKSGGQKEKLAYTVLAASLAYQFGLEWGESRSRSFRFVVIDEAFGRGSDDSAAYGLELFQKLNLQLLVVTPLQKLQVIEPYVANVGFVSNPDGQSSRLRNLTIEEYRAEKARRGGVMGEPLWSSCEELVAQVARLWERGEILRAAMGGEPLFPHPLRIRRPSARDLGERFEEVRRWIGSITAGSLAHGYSLELDEVVHRQLGRNQVPGRATVPTEAAALRMIGKTRAAESFHALRAQILSAFPALEGWIRARPLRVLELEAVWPGLLGVLTWFQTHRDRGLLYRRQLEIEGVDTKFIENHRRVLAELLEQVLGTDQLLAEPGAPFDVRFGLRQKPALVRFRLLDPSQHIQGLSDLSVPAEELARLELPVDQVVVTENEVNGLALPARPRTLVVFGQGYALEKLGAIPWLASRQLWYWGDIDTHGFIMLDRFRAHFPRARSLMMDRETLLAHRPMWVVEPEPSTEQPTRLTEAESALVRELRRGSLGERLRLEQERIGFRWVREQLDLLHS